MKKPIKYILIVLFLLFFFITNFTYLRFTLPQSGVYRFCSDKCLFEDYELGKGRDPIGSVELSFKKYKIEANKSNLVLHRRFYRRWWQIWNWVDFVTHKRWSYPYAERDEDT